MKNKRLFFSIEITGQDHCEQVDEINSYFSISLLLFSLADIFIHSIYLSVCIDQQNKVPTRQMSLNTDHFFLTFVDRIPIHKTMHTQCKEEDLSMSNKEYFNHLIIKINVY